VAGNDVISEVDVPMYVVLSKAEKRCLTGEVVGTLKYLMLYPRCRTKWVRYGRVHPCIIDTIFYFNG